MKPLGARVSKPVRKRMQRPCGRGADCQSAVSPVVDRRTVGTSGLSEFGMASGDKTSVHFWKFCLNTAGNFLSELRPREIEKS
jgi:hypothetical protein